MTSRDPKGQGRDLDIFKAEYLKKMPDRRLVTIDHL